MSKRSRRRRRQHHFAAVCPFCIESLEKYAGYFFCHGCEVVVSVEKFTRKGTKKKSTNIDVEEEGANEDPVVGEVTEVMTPHV